MKSFKPLVEIVLKNLPMDDTFMNNMRLEGLSVTDYEKWVKNQVRG